MVLGQCQGKGLSLGAVNMVEAEAKDLSVPPQPESDVSCLSGRQTGPERQTQTDHVVASGSLLKTVS